MDYFTPHSTHFIYDYMASDIWSMNTQITRKETRNVMDYLFRLAARDLLYVPSAYRRVHTTNFVTPVAGTRNKTQWVNHKGLIRQPIALWTDAGADAGVEAGGQCSGARGSSGPQPKWNHWFGAPHCSLSMRVLLRPWADAP